MKTKTTNTTSQTVRARTPFRVKLKQLRQNDTFQILSGLFAFIIFPITAMVLVSVLAVKDGPMVNVTGTENYQMATQLDVPLMWLIIGITASAIIVTMFLGSASIFWLLDGQVLPIVLITLGFAFAAVSIVSSTVGGNPNNRGLPANSVVFDSVEQFETQKKFTPQVADGTESYTPVYVKSKTATQLGLFMQPEFVRYEYIGTLEEAGK